MTKRKVADYRTGYEGVFWMMQPMRLKMMEAIEGGSVRHVDIAKITGANLSTVSKFLSEARHHGFIDSGAVLTAKGRAIKTYSLSEKGHTFFSYIKEAKKLMHDGHGEKKQKHVQN